MWYIIRTIIVYYYLRQIELIKSSSWVQGVSILPIIFPLENKSILNVSCKVNSGFHAIDKGWPL